jgi:hypothetical protein
MAKTGSSPSDVLLLLFLIALSMLGPGFACVGKLIRRDPGDGDTPGAQRDQSGGADTDQGGGADTDLDAGSTDANHASTDPDVGGSDPDVGGSDPDVGDPDLDQDAPDPDLGTTSPDQGGPAPTGPGDVDRSGVLEQAAGGWVNQGLVKPGVASTGTGWGDVWGDSCASKTIQLKSFLTYYRSAGGQWILAQDASQGSIGGQISITKQPDGSFTIITKASKNKGWGHFWINEAGKFPADTQGVFVTMDVLGPKGCSMDVGFDWWSGAKGVVGNLQAKPLTGSWRSYAFSSVPLAALQSNPPPGY